MLSVRGGRTPEYVRRKVPLFALCRQKGRVVVHANAFLIDSEVIFLEVMVMHVTLFNCMPLGDDLESARPPVALWQLLSVVQIKSCHIRLVIRPFSDAQFQEQERHRKSRGVRTNVPRHDLFPVCCSTYRHT